MSSFKSLVKKKLNQKINLYLDLDETLIYSIDMRHRKILPKHVEQFKHHNFENAYVILLESVLLFPYFYNTEWHLWTHFALLPDLYILPFPLKSF